jgi:hypothetical protein
MNARYSAAMWFVLPREGKKTANCYAVVDGRGGGDTTSRERRKLFLPVTGSAEFVKLGLGNKIPVGTTKADATTITCSAFWQQLIVQADIPPA